MRDPELVQRAERAATALEQALIHWRQRHGLDDEPLQPVTSYVGYSATEPWGQPRVVLGVHAEEAERLAAILEGHDCIGPVHAGISGWPTRRQAEASWTSVSDLPLSRVGSVLPTANGPTAAGVPAVPFMAPANQMAASDLEPLPPEEFADVDADPPSGGVTAEQFAGPAATWSELVGHEPAGQGAMAGRGLAPGEGPTASQEQAAGRGLVDGHEGAPTRAVGRPPAKDGPSVDGRGPAERGPDEPKAAGAVADKAAASDGKAASPKAAPARRRVVAPRPRTSPDDSPAPPELRDRGTTPKVQGSATAKRTKPGEPIKDRPARTRLQPAAKSTRARRTGQRPAAGNWPAVDGQPSDKSV